MTTNPEDDRKDDPDSTGSSGVELDVDDWADQRAPDPAPVADQPRSEPASEPAEEPPALLFPTLPAFVAHLATWYRREVFDSYERTWCPCWWRHPEAVVRLEAIWRAFEALRTDPGTGISVWLRDHADVHMAQLLAPTGPFRGCTARDGHSPDPLPPLPLVDPPDDWWTAADSGL